VDGFLLLHLIDPGIKSESEVAYIKIIGTCMEIDLDNHHRDIESFWFLQDKRLATTP
jgi:hypothetical protein